MEPKAEKFKDPLIEEVRERRRQLLIEHGNDLRKLFETIQRRQAAHPQNLVDLRRKKTRRR